MTLRDKLFGIAFCLLVPVMIALTTFGVSWSILAALSLAVFPSNTAVIVYCLLGYLWIALGFAWGPEP